MRFRTHWLYWVLIVQTGWIFGDYDSFNMWYIWALLALGFVIDWRIQVAKKNIDGILNEFTLYLKCVDGVWTARINEEEVGAFNYSEQFGEVKGKLAYDFAQWLYMLNREMDERRASGLKYPLK